MVSRRRQGPATAPEAPSGSGPRSSALRSSSVPTRGPSPQGSLPRLECPRRQLVPSCSICQMSPPQPALPPSFTTVTSDSLPGCCGLVYLFIMLPACPRTQAP